MVEEVCRAKYQQRDSICVSSKQRELLFAVTVSIARAAILSSTGKNGQAGNKVEAIDHFKDAKVCEEASK